MVICLVAQLCGRVALRTMIDSEEAIVLLREGYELVRFSSRRCEWLFYNDLRCVTAAAYHQPTASTTETTTARREKRAQSTTPTQQWKSRYLHTVLPRLQGVPRNPRMRVRRSRHNHHIHPRVAQRLLHGPPARYAWVVSAGVIIRLRVSLDDTVEPEGGHGNDEGDVEDFGREAIADHANGVGLAGCRGHGDTGGLGESSGGSCRNRGSIAPGVLLHSQAGGDCRHGVELLGGLVLSNKAASTSSSVGPSEMLW
jgi:hypothetical protein